MNFPYTSPNTAFLPLHQGMKERNSSAITSRFSNPRTGRSWLKGNQWQMRQASACHRDRMRSDWCLYQKRGGRVIGIRPVSWAEITLIKKKKNNKKSPCKTSSFPLVPLNEITSFSEEWGGLSNLSCAQTTKEKKRHSGFSHHPKSGFINSKCSTS